MADLATAYIQLVPSLRGAEKTIEGELSGIAGKSGGKAGDALGESMGEGLMGKMGGLAASAAKVFAGAFAAKKIFDFGKAAFDAYADFEQLSGGMEKLFGDAADTVQAHAQHAFANMGLSANDYMQNVTTFSAALISDLGGDTAAAAEAADKAMTSMADNASIFGSDIESVQNAYKGFAKQQYSMLDNLNLGYGGSKAEMERLIADANEYAESIGEASDLSIESFSDIVDAIDLVQRKQNIAGNAAKESSKTLSGSIAATKAAWQNLVTEFGKPDADIGARIADMLKAVMGEGGEGGLLRNVTTEVGVIARNMIGAVADGISAGFDWLVGNAPALAERAMQGLSSALDGAMASLQSLMSGEGGIDIMGMLFGEEGIATRAGEMLAKVGDAIAAHLPELGAKLGEILGTVGQFLVDNTPVLTAKLYEGYLSLMEWVTSHGPEIVAKVSEVVGTVIDAVWSWIVTNGPRILEAVGTVLSSILSSIAAHGPAILGNIAETIGAIVGTIISAAGEMLGAAIEFMGGLITGTSQEGEKLHQWFTELPGNLLAALGDLSGLLVDAGVQIVNGLINGITSTIDGAATALMDGIGGAVEGVLGFLNIGSPSKLFDWIGRMSMEGLTNGLNSGIPQLQGTLNGITAGMQATVSATYGGPTTPPRAAAPASGGWAEVTDAIGGLRGDMGHLGVYLDGNKLVGGIATRMDRALVM